METPTCPATFGEHRPFALGGKPPLNAGSKPVKPKPAPPGPAPVQADAMAGLEQATAASNRRKGMRDSIISQMAGQQQAQVLGGTTALGQMGKRY